MKYLVTGGGGFIGSHLSRRLATGRHEVVVLDNFSTGRRDNLSGAPVTVIEGDIRDFATVAEVMQGVDVVFHHAAVCSVQRSVEDPLTSHEVNVTGTLNVLEAARGAGVRRVVFASSSSVYGDAEQQMKLESLPPAPLSPYAVTKLAGEFYCRLYSQLFGVETVVLRYFNVFGPRQEPDSEYAAVIPKFLLAIMSQAQLQIYGDGTQTRDFTYVDNIVQANLAAAESSAANGQVMNIACGERWSLLDLVGRLEQILQCKVALAFREQRAGDVLHSQASIAAAQKLLAYVPAVDFDEGIRRTVAWFFAANKTRVAPLALATGDSAPVALAGLRAG